MFRRNNKTKYLFAVILLVITSFIFTNKIYAASLSILPSPSTVLVGNIVSVKIIVNTEGKPINNAEATIQFPIDMLEVVSVTKGSSIFTLWVEEPNFSNTLGKISFNGGVPTPGFTGQNGYVATVTFKAKKQGIASVIFSDGAIRENDGLGTNILTSKNLGTIQIGSQAIIDIPVVSNNGAVPVKPIIFSETHPNSDIWYSNNIATFNWKIPGGVTNLKTLFGKASDSIPTVNYDNSVTQKTLNNISDGVSYFHLRYFNLIGGSSITHYKVKIDSTAPLSFTPTIKKVDGQDLIKLNAEDATSGIDYYVLDIDKVNTIKVREDDLLNYEYKLPTQNQGKHDLIITAYDKAGNKTQSSTVFESSPITIPLLSLSPAEIITGESATILGKTDYPNNQVNIILESEGKEIKRYTQTTSQDGTFSVVTDKIKTIGSVSVWAENVFTDSIKSEPSQKVYLKVNQNDAVKVTLAIFYPLLGLILIILLLLILFIILYLGWHKYFGLKSKIEREAKETTTEVYNAMLLLKEELNNQLKSLEKVKIDRNLNEKEEAIFSDIKDNIDGIDDFVEKKLKKLM